jgi:hypothetical protein
MAFEVVLFQFGQAAAAVSFQDDQYGGGGYCDYC